MARTYSHYMIESAKVVENIRVHNCEQIPATESQDRLLAKLPPDEQPEAQPGPDGTSARTSCRTSGWT